MSTLNVTCPYCLTPSKFGSHNVMTQFTAPVADIPIFDKGAIQEGGWGSGHRIVTFRADQTATVTGDTFSPRVRAALISLGWISDVL